MNKSIRKSTMSISDMIAHNEKVMKGYEAAWRQDHREYNEIKKQTERLKGL